jgi:ribosomal protein L11
MERPVTLTYRNSKREFVLSARTKSPAFKNLVRKAFNLQSEVRYLRTAEGGRLSLEEVVAQLRGGEYEIAVEEDSSE